MNKLTLGLILAAILLVAGNVYQYQNPRTIEIPTGQEAIDSTAWVKRSALSDRETIIDSLKTRNQALADRVREQGDQIANYTSVTGRLKTQLDSLQYQLVWHSLPELADTPGDSLAVVDTTFYRQAAFGEDLFQVDGTVDVRMNPCGYVTGQTHIGVCPDAPPLQVRQDFTLTQKRDIQLDVVTTVGEDNARVLTYVTSPDFESLKYSTSTSLAPQKDFPWFWVGLGGGFLGAAILIK